MNPVPVERLVDASDNSGRAAGCHARGCCPEKGESSAWQLRAGRS